MSTVLLLQMAIIILVCIALHGASSRLGAPTLLAIILLGLLCGNHGVISVGYIGFPMAQRTCEVALIFIMFYGGFATRWQAAKPVMLEAGLLSTLGVVVTGALTGTFCHYLLHWNWAESLLMGAVMASTDAASVFSILKSKKLNLKNNLAPLIEVESGSNDPMAHMMTLIMISVMRGQATGGSIALHIVMEIVLGAGLGVLIAKGAAFTLRWLKFKTESFNSLFIFAVAILSYALPDAIGGNGYLSAYLVGLLIGNENFVGKKSMVHFFDGLTGLMEMLLFFVLGALARPSAFPRTILPALCIFAFMLLIARPLAVNTILLPFRKYQLRHRLLLSFAGLRGAASIVFAVLAINQAAPVNDIFNIVFCLVLLSMMIQGSLLPTFARKLDMIDAKGNVLRTFNEYADDEIQFGRIEITPTSRWLGKSIHDTGLPEGITVALVIRKGEAMMPSGHLLIEDGDVLVTATKPYDGTGASLKEKVVKVDSRRVGHTVGEYPGSSRIILVKRGDIRIVPDSRTVLQAGDVLTILVL